MRSVMKLFGLLILGLVACAPDLNSPELAPRLPVCKQLNEHVFRITPESRIQLDGKSEAEQRKVLERLIATVPVEDFQQCAAADEKVIACMLAAPDVAALRACVPAKKG